MERILVAMSGGVDSHVAASVLREAGYGCVGVTMRLHDAKKPGVCGAADDAEDARRAAHSLGMDHHLLDFSAQFRLCVTDPFVRAYEGGMTPNPCIDCNRTMKFDRLYGAAAEMGCDGIATGHYARIEHRDGRWILKRARCAEKDQSYVLYFLSQEQLSRTRFPLGEYESKEQVRAYAAARGFVSADKPDSEDICFVPDGDYAAYVQNYTGRTYPPGEFVDDDGTVLGTHQGIIRYTVGQRKGLGIACGRRMYVKKLLPEENRVVLTPDSAVKSARLLVDGFNWIAFSAPREEVRAHAVVRYQGTEYPARARTREDGRVEILFDIPARAACPGQAVVLYDGDTVLGGGRITEVFAC